MVSGKPLDVLQQFGELLLQLKLIGWAEVAGRIGDRFVDEERSVASAKLGQATVTSNRVQPWAQRNAVASAAQRSVGGHERQLQRVLGLVPAAEHVRAEGEDATGVSLVDGFEGSVVAGSHLGDQVSVGEIRGEPMLYAQPVSNDFRTSPHTQSMVEIGARVQWELESRFRPSRV